MSNQEKYDQAFIVGLSIDENMNLENLQYNSIEEWDSIGHMGLITELEENFEISMETDDIIDFSSYGKGKEIFKRYGIVI